MFGPWPEAKKSPFKGLLDDLSKSGPNIIVATA